MKTVLKLLIAAVLLHAVYKAGVSAMAYYQLKDASYQLLVFGSESSPEELQQGILAKAAELSVPLEPEGIAVMRDGARTTAEASYTDPIEIFPRYRYPFNYSFRVEAVALDAR